MYKDNVTSSLIEIFKKTTGYDFEDETLCKTNFFSSPLNIPVRNIVFSLYLIEKKWEIKLPTDKIEKGGFSTFEDALELVKSVV